MADLTPPDPAALWRQLVSQWEKDINSGLNAAMGTEQFSKAMNEAQMAQLRVQQATNELLNKTLAKLNLPSRDELASLSRRLLSIEDRLTGIEGVLNRMANAAGVVQDTKPAPRPRTRQPPAAAKAAPAPAAEAREAPAAPASTAKPAARAASGRARK